MHDAIYESVPRPLRRAMHRDAAIALEALGADPARVADHLVLGADRGDLHAVEGLRRAARDGMAGAPDTSVDLLLRAESLLPGGHAEADVVSAELVDAMLRAGMVSDAAARAEAVLARSHRDDVDVRLRLSLVSAMSVQNRTHDLITIAELLAANDDLGDGERALVLDQASLGRALSSDVIGGEDAARRALSLAERADDAPMIVWSLAVGSVPVKTQGRYREAIDLTSRAVEIASHATTEARLRHPLFFHGMALSDADRYDEARVAFRAALDEYDALGSVWLLSDTLLMTAIADFVTGNWSDAMPGLEAGLQTAREQGNHILIAQSHAYLAIMAIAAGDTGRAAAALDPFADELTSSAPVWAAEVVAYASAILSKEAGDTAGAYETLRRAWDFDVEREIRVNQRYLAPFVVRLALDHGHGDIAQAVVAQTEMSVALAPEIATVRSCAARCRGLVDSDTERMIEAVELARRGPRVLDHTGACEDAARLLIQAGRPEEAKPLLLEALECYDAIGAKEWAARTNATLRTLGVRRGARGPRPRATRGWESLTATERSVTLLVARGLTNREVAKRLHMSPHTVNTHLRHIYEKLDIGNRTALAAAVSHSIE
ncbi:MAG: hypothetical protein JOZ99_07345 [Actinobacteria bacterium]|nr:hypothetical protein [Actinomycetota bacterium]